MRRKHPFGTGEAVQSFWSYRTRTIAAWYTQVVSLSEQVMRFPLDLSAFLKLPGVSPRERQYVVMVAPTRCS
jgi:hypothetical protein